MTAFHHFLTRLKPFGKVDTYNLLFEPLSYERRLKFLYRFFKPEEVLVTSSFGTRSVFLLHLLSKIRPDQKVHFIDTTYHFPETIAYKKQLTQQFGLKIIDVLPEVEANLLTREHQWWKDHPRMCCQINKVAPLEPIKAKHKVWISGLMRWQTDFRSRLQVFEQQGEILKFHPLIDLDEGEWRYQVGRHQLPAHPLESLGFGSVGCTHCTQKGEGRSGRWMATGQSECGLHPGYFRKQED